MKTIDFLIILSAATIGCNSESQNNPEKQKVLKVSNDLAVGTNPKVDIKVNMQYNKNGNMIKYDSTYSYFHTTTGMNSIKIVLDSVFSDFI